MKSFGWDLTYNCNYKCHYCQVYADKEDSSPTRPLSDWVKAWNKIYEKYSECEIFISGGEPSVYPDFFQLIKELSKIHRLNICTNLSWDPEKLFEFPWPDNILISATFHPFNANPKEFISKIKSLKNNLDRVNFLLYPGQSDSFLNMKDQLLKDKICLHPIPARSPKDDQPLNTPEELALIEKFFLEDNDMSKEQIGFLSLESSPKGRLCRAGYNYAMVRPDGQVNRCPLIKDQSLGNILSPHFKFFDQPAPCTSNVCYIPNLILPQVKEVDFK